MPGGVERAESREASLPGEVVRWNIVINFNEKYFQSDLSRAEGRWKGSSLPSVVVLLQELWFPPIINVIKLLY